MDDFSTNNLTGAPTPLDEVLANSSTGIYQLRNFTAPTERRLPGGLSLAHDLQTRRRHRRRRQKRRDDQLGMTVNTTTGQITISPAR